MAPSAAVVVCEIVERNRHHFGRVALVDVTVGVASTHCQSTVAAVRLVVEQVVHDEIAVLFAHKPVGHGLAVLMMVAGGEGVLSAAAYAVHRVFESILHHGDVPS